jgi:hypothetical protein
MPVIPALGRLKQEFQVSLSYIVRLCPLNKNKKQTTKRKEKRNGKKLT